eukprot:364694-Chlamydomonas_euryale.AAC.7
MHANAYALYAPILMETPCMQIQRRCMRQCWCRNRACKYERAVCAHAAARVVARVDAATQRHELLRDPLPNTCQCAAVKAPVAGTLQRPQACGLLRRRLLGGGCSLHGSYLPACLPASSCCSTKTAAPAVPPAGRIRSAAAALMT